MTCAVPVIVTVLVCGCCCILLMKYSVASDPDKVSHGWLQSNRYSKDGDKLC